MEYGSGRDWGMVWAVGRVAAWPAEGARAARSAACREDLNSLGTSERGFLVNRDDGTVVEIGDPWLVRARRCARIGRAWVDAWWPEVAAGRLKAVRWGLTLRPGIEWRPRMVSDLMARVRRELGAGLVDYFVVAEMQGRGAVHFNVLLIVRRNVWLEMPDKSGWWPWGSTNAKTCKARNDLLYAMRYVTKPGQKGGGGGPGFPKGLRLWSTGSAKRLRGAGRVFVKLARLPRWLYRQVVVRALELGAVPRKVRGEWDANRSGDYRSWWWFDGKRYGCPWRWQRVVAV